MKDTNRALALLTLLVVPSAGFAQEEAVPTLPTTTVVTGELWESDLQKTTASVTVLGSESLENTGVQHFEDVINAIPNLTWTGGTSRPRYIQIRGVGENSQFEGETPDSSVRFLVDDLDFTGIGTVANLFDVQQVEVLRGPQAGAFGANAAGGAVRIVTNDPTPYWSGQAEATVGNDDLRSAGIAVGGPLLENDPEQLTFRLALHKLEQDGFRENVFLGKDDTNERDELTTRLKFRWKPSQDWTIDGQLFYADVDNGFDEFTLNNSRTRTFSDEPGRDEQHSFGASLNAQWSSLQSAQASFLTNYMTTDSFYSFDLDWTNPTQPSSFSGFQAVDRARDVFSQEIRFDSTEDQEAIGWIHRWTLGSHFSLLDEVSDIDFTGDFPSTITTRFELETYALFGQVAHHFSERSRIILGLRYEHYRTKATPDRTDSDRRTKTSSDLFGGKVAFEYDLNDSTMVFLSAARGYKGGGANLDIEDGQADLSFDDETLYNFEAGFRGNWLEDRISGGLAAFYLIRDDAQIRGSVGDGVNFSYFTVNDDRVYHYGIEADARLDINSSWSVGASLGLIETKRTDFDVLNPTGETTPDTVNQSLRRLANSPPVSYNLALLYESDTRVFARVEINGKSSQYESNTHNEKRSGFTVFNALAGFRQGNWTFTVWTKNLFDENYEERVFFFANEGDFSQRKRYEAPAAPRTFGITANYRW